MPALKCRLALALFAAAALAACTPTQKTPPAAIAATLPATPAEPPAPPASLEALAENHFNKPVLSKNAPVTYFHAISSHGDYVGQGKTFSYDAKDIHPEANRGAITLNIAGWGVEFSAPRGKKLEVGQYPDARRYPFNGSRPGINIDGEGRGSNQVFGEFVVWELVEENGKITRLAIDFIHHSERPTTPPLYGMLRYNSTFE